jgi:transcriptional regulator of acetoin/glycerol metabolism
MRGRAVCRAARGVGSPQAQFVAINCAAIPENLAKTNGNIATTSQLLGISRPTLHDLMNRLRLK